MPSLYVFNKQDDAFVGWSDAISADSFMNFETNEARFRVKFGQALNGHVTRMIEYPISNLEVSERRYYAFYPYRLARSCIRAEAESSSKSRRQSIADVGLA